MHARHTASFTAVSLLTAALTACGSADNGPSPSSEPDAAGSASAAGESGGQGQEAAGHAAGSAADGGSAAAGSAAWGGAGSAGSSTPVYEGAGAGASGGGAGSPGGTPSVATQQSFPVGFALASPVSVVASAPHASLQPSLWRRLLDFGRAARRALLARDFAKLAWLGGKLLPVSTAQAAPADQLEIKAYAAEVSDLLAGDAKDMLGDRLELERFFETGGNANCYGPSLDYQNHQDSMPPGASGQLPGGDLGLWLEHEGATEPCVAAQLNRRIQGVKGRTQQGLLLMAALRKLVETSTTLELPAAGATLDLRMPLEAALHASPKLAALAIEAASISLDEPGEVYSYRVVFDTGESGAAARFAEVVLQHRPGASGSAYNGVLQVAGFSLSADAARGCSDALDSASGLYQIADVGSVSYRRSGQTLSFGARSGNYCGHPADRAAAQLATQVASFDAAGELDPQVKLTQAMPPSTTTRGASTGWLGNFSRFAGDFQLDSVEGDFLYAWQAGVQDNHARMLAFDIAYNTMTDERTLQGFFGFADDIAVSDGNMQGMICNWAGPGNQHTPSAQFQSQLASMSAGALEFVIPDGGSKIAYAPTNSCSSTTTLFDRNLDHMIDPGEGEGLSSALDTARADKSVAEELALRGFSVPSLWD